MKGEKLKKKTLILLGLMLSVALIFLISMISCQGSTTYETSDASSTTAEATVETTPVVSELLCQYCHDGIHTKWAGSPHADTQADVASELGEECSGQTPDEVLHGEDAENCIACHSPTAITANGGMTEAQTLNYFFTTTDEKFTEDTAAANAAEWPSVSCTVCHDPMNPKEVSYFNSSSQKYELMENTDELCGQCHGNLRFFDTDHRSYNILSGTGGIGVPDQQTMPGVTCTDCHMFASDVDGSNSAMFHGHTFAIAVEEADGKNTSSCTHCHATIDTAAANTTIATDKSSFESLDVTAQENIAAATKAMKCVQDKTLQDKLEEAQHNLEYAESDNSGGFHNHKYLMALLKDANDKALEILSALGK